jgi:hypothetical protein
VTALKQDRNVAVHGPGADLWLLVQLARQSLETGSLRGYWPGLAREGAQPGVVTRTIAGVVWVALVPVVPAMAARRRRLIARALEGVVRAVVAGVDAPTAVNRAVAWLEGKRIDPIEARADLERLLAGFLSSAPADKATTAGTPRAGSGFTSAG